jgi:hypothetical protein
VDHREFCEESLERPIYNYVFVTNQPIPEFSMSQIERSGVQVVQFETDVAALVPALLEAFEITSGG